MTNISSTPTFQDIEHVFGGTIPDYHPSSYIQSRLNDGFAYTAEVNHEPVGFLIYSIWWGNCPFIELIKIKEGHQRKGLGLMLVNQLKSKLKSEGFDKIISSSEVINPLGNNFHTKAGFQKLNTLDLPHGEEAFYSMKVTDSNIY